MPEKATPLIRISSNIAANSEAGAHIVALHERKLAYAFGGPDPNWCSPETSQAMMLPEANDGECEGIQVRPYRGCLKYATCDLIPSDQIRWTPWEKLSEAERNSLRKARCYRANGTSWDGDALGSRQNQHDGKWIANPLGLRTAELQRRTELLPLEQRGRHRDLIPCPVGGCVTPEMQRDHEWEQRKSNSKYLTDWGSFRPCPYYFRHTDHQLSSAVPNPQRFTQCYVNLPAFRNYLRRSNLIVMAPIFRSSQRTESLGEAFWYPFYSGFGYLQLPTNNILGTEEQDTFAALRWQATTLARLQQTKAFIDGGTQRVFSSAERGNYLAAWERSARVVSISEGQTSAVLLQWVIWQRLARAIALPYSSEGIDFRQRVRWLFEPDEQILRKLVGLGYAEELMTLLGVEDAGAEGFFRDSFLSEDLELLGLIDRSGEPTARVDCAIKWLLTRLDDGAISEDDTALGNAVREWLGPKGSTLVSTCQSAMGFTRVMNLCEVMIYGALREKCDVTKTKDGLRVHISSRSTAERQLQQLGNPNISAYATISRLFPPVHILVRAGSTLPLRWFFVPLSVDLAGASLSIGNDTRPELRVQSAIITMLRDDIRSLPYRLDDHGPDPVYNDLVSLMPLLAFTADIEEELTRETLINYQDWLDTYNVEISQLRHIVRAIQLHIAETNDLNQRPLQLLLKYLELHFTMPSAGGNQSRTVAIPVVPALKEAIEAFNIYYTTYKAVTANLEPGAVDAHIETRLLHGHYPTESIDALRGRAHSELVILMLDLLIQRYKAKGGIKQQLSVTCEQQHDDIIIRVRVDSPFSMSLEWDSRRESLDRFPRNRGFFSMFSLARALGSKWQAVGIQGNVGEIALAFEKTCQ